MLAAAHANGVEQLLQASMWLDRVIRFNEIAAANQAIAKVENLRLQTDKAFANLVDHRAKEHQEVTVA
jgi:hypothetical protein